VHCHVFAMLCKVFFSRTQLAVCADMTTKYPKFSGSGYIAFPVLRGAHREFHMIAELRPDGLDGLIMFSAGHPDAHSDFLSLSLQRGKIELRYDVYVMSSSSITCSTVLIRYHIPTNLFIGHAYMTQSNQLL